MSTAAAATITPTAAATSVRGIGAVRGTGAAATAGVAAAEQKEQKQEGTYVITKETKRILLSRHVAVATSPRHHVAGSR